MRKGDVMKEILQRFEQMLWEESLPSDTSAEELYQALVATDTREGWYWSDIDYKNPLKSFWPAAKHYERMQLILNCFGKSRLLCDGEYAEKMTGALRYWLSNDFKNPNWWHDQIGTPQGIGDIAIRMRSVLDKETLAEVADLISRGSMAKNKAIADEWTGANFMWGALNTIRHALLTEDDALMRAVVERIAKEISVDMPEGIQSDFSFFQHGPRLYSGGYGRSFTHKMSIIIFLLNGTKYQLPTEKTELFLSFVLEGLRPMTKCSALDWACVGREIARIDAIDLGIIKDALELLSKAPSLPRKQEIEEFLESANGGSQLNTTKYFDKAFMLCHHFDGIYVGAKLLNDKIFGAEICNGEAELCYNMSYGTHTCIMRNGKEYFNVNSVWDYSRVPGTTAFVETDEQLLEHKDWAKLPLPNDHFGGRQNGRRAAIYELAEHDGIKMQVADFAFEDGFVCLGAEVEIRAHQGVELTTTVDQCILQGEVVAKDGSVIHNGIRYTALQDTRIEHTAEAKSGSWRRNNIALSEEIVRKDILTLSIDHPADRKCKYAYMISSADTPTPSVEVLQNDSDVQAIRLYDGSIMAVFHNAAKISVDGREIIGEAGAIIC